MRIVLRGDGSEFPASLHDISLGGARISARSLPVEVEQLSVTDDHVGEIVVDVRWSAGDIRWSDGDRMGVAFEQGAPGVQAPDPVPAASRPARPDAHITDSGIED